MEMVKYPKMPNLYNVVLGEDIFACEKVSIQEKIHGTQARIGISKEEVVVGSRRRILKMKSAGIQDQLEVCKTLGEAVRGKLLRNSDILDTFDITIFGEFAGPKVQKGIYYGDTREFYAFDVVLVDKKVGEDNPLSAHESETYWLSVYEVETFCLLWGLETVPFLAIDVPPDLELFNSLYAEKSHIVGDDIMEGIVIKSSPVQLNYLGHPVYAKHKNDKWSEQVAAGKQPKYSPYTYTQQFITHARVLSAVDVLKERGDCVGGMSDMKFLPTIIVDDIIEEENIELADEKEYKKLRRAISKKVAQEYKSILQGNIA